MIKKINACWFRSAARVSGWVLLCLMLGACASATKKDAAQEVSENHDKFEGFNRAVFRFNDGFDRWFFKPVAKGYDKAVPTMVKAGIGNFFSNIGEIPKVINDGLQWKWGQAGHDSGRFVINSTIGLLGLLDVASELGLKENDDENFTQTLSVWGVPRGPYIVLPFLGPNTLRGTFSLPADWYTSPLTYATPTEAVLGANALDLLHTRAELLKSEELISGDRYLFIREVYLQRLDYLEQDGEVSDDFGDDFGEDDEYGSFEEEY